MRLRNFTGFFHKKDGLQLSPVTGLGNVGAFIGASRISEDSCLPSRYCGSRVGVTNSFIGIQLVSNVRSIANRMLTRRSGEAATVTDVVAQLLLSRKVLSATLGGAGIA